MVWQTELFPRASEVEIQRTKFLLERYMKMRLLMFDFEQNEEELRQVAIDGEVARRIDPEDLHADKTANAAVLAEKQLWVYEQYKLYTRQLQRAAALIQDEETRQAVELRYMKGLSYKETILFFKHGLSRSTVRRKLLEGARSIADTLKLMGFFDNDNAQF
ncbi:hypothetical protein D3P09_02410 [Paenibacillus pinisoli]|uniref:Uncharacterized protein n=1 Tax=Paenibacillus pinisoli TaxID=1276110 RepID=A0A3A6Q4V2_9BACL|nr:hypothetical protein [Paenibacillus pinisoli]RJX40894.1 hypothetical protein D3P09_02410 [Paenibacillus pinisoli]